MGYIAVKHYAFRSLIELTSRFQHKHGSGADSWLDVPTGFWLHGVVLMTFVQVFPTSRQCHPRLVRAARDSVDR